MSKTKQHWYDYLWIASVVYLALGFFNIVFAWLGMICFILPLGIALIIGLSRNVKPPKFLSSNWFRSGFLAFFMTMFGLMLYATYLVFAGAPLKETVTLLWVFKLPWHWTNTAMVPPGVAQFAFGFYGVMLTSTVLGLITMMLFKPRSWCIYCPMGTMTQGICELKHRKEE
ncbi:hypothetical protein M2145_001641 [Lachnospiraceae bacterium PF1-21]